MKLHELKIKRTYHDDVIAGRKTFEIRKNDRDFQVGDLVHFNVVEEEDTSPTTLREWIKRVASDPYKVFRITYVLKDIPEYGLDKDYCIFGITEMKEEVQTRPQLKVYTEKR